MKKYLSLFLVFAAIFSFSAVYSQTKKPFSVVLDAGHGGKDPGALGSFLKEKDLNLRLVKLIGERLENNNSDIKVIYTRKTDIFLALETRAQIANNAHADLFVSIHTNAVENNTTVSGTETYTLGLSKTKANLDVAMRENSVILLESDYKEKYKGFDPKSVDSYIMFELTQNKFIEQSINVASYVQENFVSKANRKDRGVRQAGFLVLHAVAMPSILIEMGFISNPEEEKFLGTDAGMEQLADAVYAAILKYKRDYERKSGIQPDDKKDTKKNDVQQPSPVVEPKTATKIVDKPDSITTVQIEPQPKDEIVYKLQLFAAKQPVKNKAEFKGLKLDCYREGDWYKYTYGSTSSFEQINKIKQEIADKFDKAFVVAFKNGVRISVQEALNQK